MPGQSEACWIQGVEMANPTYEEIERGLRHAWFPVAGMEFLDRPQSADLLGQPLVVFRRDDGRPAVTGRRCPHRGGDLSLGAVVDDAIECPYHGWRYSGDNGGCTLIPSLQAGGGIPSNAKVPVFPAVERYGLVWTCLAEPLAAEPPHLPELEPLEMSYRVAPPFDTQAGLLHALENFRDVAHFPFVHRKSMGHVPVEVEPLDVRSEGFETWLDHDYAASQGTHASYRDRQVHLRYHAVAPSLATVLLDYGGAGQRVVMETFCPVSARGGCRIWLVSGTGAQYTATSPQEALEGEITVVSEDMVMLESVTPPEVPLHGEAPHASVPADRYTMTTRQAYLAFVREALASQHGSQGTKPEAPEPAWA